MKTAILIDGAFFIERYRALYPGWKKRSPARVAEDLYEVLIRTLRKINKRENIGIHSGELYRIFFYDCVPLIKKVKNPVSKRTFEFGGTKDARFRIGFHKELKRSRKVALRLGRLSDRKRWMIRPGKIRELLDGKIQMLDISESDIQYDVQQKGVDIKIGLDIASLAFKKSVDQIILISGDSDFVPAAKLARREGIDFILDSMWNHINPDLHEHIDGLIDDEASCWPKPVVSRKKSSLPQ